MLKLLSYHCIDIGNKFNWNALSGGLWTDGWRLWMSL